MTQLITNDDEIKELHRNRLLELCLKSIGEIPQLDEPNQEQSDWLKRRMKVGEWHK
jgi:hypothetical protein